MAACPKCGGPLYIAEIDDEIRYLKVELACDNSLPDPDTDEAPTCDFKEVREIDCPKCWQEKYHSAPGYNLFHVAEG